MGLCEMPRSSPLLVVQPRALKSIQSPVSVKAGNTAVSYVNRIRKMQVHSFLTGVLQVLTFISNQGLKFSERERKRKSNHHILIQELRRLSGHASPPLLRPISLSCIRQRGVNERKSAPYELQATNQQQVFKKNNVHRIRLDFQYLLLVRKDQQTCYR